MWTSDGRFCLGGITRGNVLEVCRGAGIAARETTFSLTDVYSAQEAFVTGTFAGLVPGPQRRRPHDRLRRAAGRSSSASSSCTPSTSSPTSPAGRAVTGDAVTRVAMWSGPRNISTAMMRAWENRPDTVVVDEPFYAAYLHRTGLDHPPATRSSPPSRPTSTAVVRRPARAAARRAARSTTPST